MLRQLTRDPGDPVAEEGDVRAIDAVINLVSQSEGASEAVISAAVFYLFFLFLMSAY